MIPAFPSWWPMWGVWLARCDALVAGCLFPLAVIVLTSGLDDMALNLMWLWAYIRRRVGRPVGLASKGTPEEKTIAIFVPLWHEHAVIAGMVEHNIAAIDYENYHFFIGAYPNDDPTLDAVRDLESRFEQVHLAVCPHNGPTSKADCLNWIYQRMLLYEEHNGVQFDIVVTHDAEDLIHPEALGAINASTEEYDMIQVPVLPLPTPVSDFVHGIYCDEFAEWQTKDMPARQIMRSFLPSNGVGTGYTRRALEMLAESEHNLIFEPACLTEDYENGLRLHRLECRQKFLPLTISRNAKTRSGAPLTSSIIATREFFPRTAHSAIRQRSRWILGIGLQCWERNGWQGNVREKYWFWRDRKGLAGNPLSLLSNFIFLYGALTWLASRAMGTPWGLAKYSLHPWLILATLGIQIVQTSVRISCCARVYGLRFALAVPLRTVFGNWINTVATWKAVRTYVAARMRGEPLRWVKTEHAYPTRSALVEHKRKLGEILIGSGYAEESTIREALRNLPSGVRLGEYLVQLGAISEAELYEALSIQQSLPAGRLEPWIISSKVARALPRHVVQDCRVFPFRIASGSMFLASPEIPTDDLTRILRGFTRLSLRFHLVTPGNFDELAGSLL